MKICREIPDLFHVGQIYHTLYLKTQVNVILSSDINTIKSQFYANQFYLS